MKENGGQENNEVFILYGLGHVLQNINIENTMTQPKHFADKPQMFALARFLKAEIAL
jgi:hypothetical protein